VFQASHVLVELLVRQLDQRTGFAELIVRVRAFLGVPMFNVHLYAFDDKIQFMVEVLDEHTSVALNLSRRVLDSHRHDLLNLGE